MQQQEVVCGLDLGSWTFKISAFDGSKLQIVTNQANFRQTPSLVAYTSHERQIGQAALMKIKSNFANTIRAPTRLLTLGQSQCKMDEEMQSLTVKYEMDEELFFYVEHQNEKIKLKAEQILLSLFYKVLQITQLHRLQMKGCYIVVPEYICNIQRKTILRCAQNILRCNEISLIDDWLALSYQYSYFRSKDIKQTKGVIFLDVGYSKISIFAVAFGPQKAQLIASDHLKYTGSRNMDFLIAQFYNNEFKKQNKTQLSLFGSQKALVKLLQAIQKQRKVLSANSQHAFLIECLLQDYDLNFNMTRSQFQSLITPVLNDITALIDNFKLKISHLINIHSVELIGGTSRMPIIKNIIITAFDLQPAKTLNSSQCFANGAALFGALQLKFIQPNNYIIQERNPAKISLSWRFCKGENFCGEDIKGYTKSIQMFPAGIKVPNEFVLQIPENEQIQMIAYYNTEIIFKSIYYLRFTAPNLISFILKSDRTINVKLQKNTFSVQKNYFKKQKIWNEMQKIEDEMQRNDTRIKTGYQLRNHFESLLYELKRNSLDISPELNEHLNWLQNQSLTLSFSVNDLLILEQKIQQVNQMNEQFSRLTTKKMSQNDDYSIKNKVNQQNNQKDTIQLKKLSPTIQAKFEEFKKQIQRTLNTVKDEKRKNQLHLLRQNIVQSYEMSHHPKQAKKLTQEKIDAARREIVLILLGKNKQ